jgi:hypothetical protein
MISSRASPAVRRSALAELAEQLAWRATRRGGGFDGLFDAYGQSAFAAWAPYTLRIHQMPTTLGRTKEVSTMPSETRP